MTINTRLRSPILWYGGKGKMTTKLLQYLPEHVTYVEVFGGGASLLFAKPQPSKIEVYNDVDSNLVNLFRVIRSKKLFPEFERLCNLTPYSREERQTAYEGLLQGKYKTKVKRAWAFFLMARQGFSGKAYTSRSWGMVYGGKSYYKAMNGVYCGESVARSVASYLKAIHDLPLIHERLRTVQIEHNSFEKILATYDTSSTLFYVDPPYVSKTRKKGARSFYLHEMTDKQHLLLTELLLKVKGKVMLSCYFDKDIHSRLIDNGWFRKDWSVACNASGRTKASGNQGKGSATRLAPRVETILMNYDIEKEKQEERGSRGLFSAADGTRKARA